MGTKPKSVWRLRGYDTFAEEPYPLEGEYASERLAQAAAKQRMAELEESQPSASSGGQSGIQDQIYIIRPDGTEYRFFSSLVR